MHTELEHEVARLLRQLPEDAGRPYDWNEFRRRALAAPAAAARVGRLRALAAAAVIALAVGAATIRFAAGPHPAGAPAAIQNGPTAAAEHPAALLAAEGDEARAEDWLASLPREPAVVRVGTRAAVETLEDHIAEVDDLMNSERASRAPPARVHALQQERARLVSSLVQVRYAETLADASR
jgi:hypothetical protein